MLKWTLGTTGSGARLRQTHRDLIDSVIKKQDPRKINFKNKERLTPIN